MVSGGWARGRAATAAVVLVASLSACATMPTGGPVVRGSGGGEDASDPSGNYVRMLPAGPQKGVDTKGLVKGFLRDMASFEDDHDAAREYLTSKKRPEWSSDGPVVVYKGSGSVDLDVAAGKDGDGDGDGDTATVRMRTPRVATIDRSGQYTPADPDSMVDVTFELTKNHAGEWRISELPDELILSRTDVDRAYRPRNLYFFNRDHSTLVPDPVLMPVSGTKLASRLVTMLTSGPTEWLAPAVESAFPKGTRSRTDFDPESGELTVELSDVRGGVRSEEHYQMGAQLNWTLKQVPQIKTFSLTVNGDEVDLPGDAGENLQSDADLWKSVNPSGVTGNVNAYYIRDEQMWSLSGDERNGKQEETRVQGAPGDGGTTLARYAVSLNEEHAAGITSDHERVVTAETREGSSYETVLSGGTGFKALSWDGYGNLWVARDDTTGSERPKGKKGKDSGGTDDARTEGSKLWMLRDGTDPVEVNAPELRGERVTQIRASRDGTRVAVITKRDGKGEGRLSVGRVVTGDEGVSLGGFMPLASELRGVSDIAWNDGDQLAVLGQKEHGALQGLLVSLNGNSETTSVGAPSGDDMSAIAAAPGRPLLSGTGDDRIWMTNDRVAWQPVTDGTNPVYPG